MSSPFLAIPESEWVASNALAFAIRDRYPVSRGHTLVIPRRQVATWFEETAEEQQALFALVGEAPGDTTHRYQSRPLADSWRLARLVPSLHTLQTVHLRLGTSQVM